MVDNKVALPAGTVLQNNYKIINVLGQGGFGITYLAHDEALHQKVAIKEYLPNTLATRDQLTKAVHLHSKESAEAFQWGLKRFLEEARILARLSHPNIVRVMHFMAMNNTGYMIMQYEQGRVLKKWAEQFPGNRPPQDQLFKFLGPLLDALREVHAAGLAHRDIKPDNIYMRADGSPVLLDFGAARNVESGLSHTLAAIVTSGYSPNEQYGNVADQGPWTDIYAMGAVLYRLISGTTPPDAPSRINASLSEINDPCVKLSELNVRGYSREFLAAIDWALEVSPKSRPQNVDEWISAFGQQAQEATQVVTRPVRTIVTEMPADDTAIVEMEDTAPVELEALTQPVISEAVKTEATQQEGQSVARSIPYGRIAGIAAMLIVLAGGGAGGYWWYTQPIQDLVGDNFPSAKQVGALSKEIVTVSDHIGADDVDVIEFDLHEDSELHMNIAGGSEEKKLRIFDSNQKELSLYGTNTGKVSELTRGTYFLHMISPEKYLSRYTASLSALPADIRNRPKNSIGKALDLGSDIGDQPVRYRGKLYVGQKEHYFRLSMSRPGEIALTANTVAGKGRASLADSSGLVIESEKLSPDEGKNVRAVVPAGTYHVIISSNDKKIFEYGLSLRVDHSKKDITGPDEPIEKRKFVPIEKPKGKVWTVSAVAKMDNGMDKNEALLAAQSLARVKLADVAQGKKDALSSVTSRLSNIVKLFPRFNEGVPFNEVWDIKWASDKVTVVLKAEFEKTKGNDYLKAALDKTVIKSHTPITFNLQSQRDMYMGIFAWQADGTVLRLYPRRNGRYFIMTEGREETLPRKEEKSILSAPMPGRTSSDEAIFAVGCYAQLDYTSLAASIWEQPDKSISSSDFFQRLATSCKQGLSIRVLHYSVYKPA